MKEITFNDYRNYIKPIPNSLSAQLSLGLVTFDHRNDIAYLRDNVECKHYEFAITALKRVLYAIKLAAQSSLMIQRKNYTGKAEYLPVESSAFLWYHLEFDWSDIQKINKILNPIKSDNRIALFSTSKNK